MIHGEHTANRDRPPRGIRIDCSRIAGGPDTVIPGDLAKPVAAVPEGGMRQQAHCRYLRVHRRSNCIGGVAVIVSNLSWQYDLWITDQRLMKSRRCLGSNIQVTHNCADACA